MDERGVRALLSRAAESVDASDDLAARAERRYRRRRARGRALAAGVVVVVVGVGIATAAAVGGDHTSVPPVVEPTPSSVATPTSQPVGQTRAIDTKLLVSLAFVDADVGYAVEIAVGRGVLAKTTDGARTWRAIGWMPGRAGSVTAAPDGGILASGNDGVYRTADGGAHWDRTLTGAAQIVASSERVWATVTCDRSEPCLDRLVVSDDSGRTWNTGDLQADAIGAIAVSQHTSNIAFVLYQRQRDVSDWNVAGTTEGLAWGHHPTPCPAWSSPQLAVGGDNVSLMLDCGGDDRDRVYVSGDRGEVWAETVPLPATGRVASIAAIPETDSMFVVGKRTAVGPGWSNGPLEYPVAGQWRWRANPQPIGDVYAFAAVSDGLYFSSSTGVYFDDPESGRRALRSGEPPAPPGQSVDVTGLSSLSFVDADHGYALSDREIVRSDDGGRTWSVVNAAGFLSAEGLHFETESDGFAWGGGGAGFTRDGGRSWSPTSIAQLDVLGWADGRAWAYTPCTGDAPCGPRRLFVSDDVGRSWREVTTFRPIGYPVTAFVAIDRSTAYLLDGASYRYGTPLVLRVTHDGGATWTTEPVPCSVDDRRSVASNGRSLLVACADGEPLNPRNRMLRSTDDGVSWETLPWRFDVQHFHSVTNYGALYLADVTTRGSYVSSDDGDSWALPPELNQNFAASSTQFFVTQGVGVWAVSHGNLRVWFSPDGADWEVRIAPQN